MKILAYDLATKTGAAFGAPCAAPYCWSFSVDGDHPAKFSQIARAVAGHIKNRQPDLVAIEAPFVGKNASAARLLFGFRGIVYAICALRGVPVIEYTPADVRRHFLGKAGRGKPTEAIRARCQALGWVASDADQLDAAALWSKAASVVSDDHSKMTLNLGDAR